MLKNKAKSKSNDGNVGKKEWQAYLDHTKGIERDYMAEIIRSRKVWQMIALLCMLLTFASVLFHQFNPVTEKEPFVLRVNDTTGVVDIVSTITEKKSTYGEAVDGYFLAKYVTSYESYNYHNIQNDYDTTILMSSDAVAREYKAIYDSSGGNVGRDTLLGETGTRKVNIISVVPNTETSTASVRFEVVTKSSNGSHSENYIATITYEYLDAKISSEVGLINPLGFVVTSYRADKENL